MMTEREVTTESQGQGATKIKISKIATQGIPQGGTLSPIIFNLLMEELIKKSSE